MDFENLFEGLFSSESADPATESADNYDFFGLDDDSACELTPAAESQIVLETIMGTFEDMNEFADYVTESAAYWEAYGLIDSAAVAMEAVKRLTINNWKKVNFDRLVHRECIRIEARRNPPTSLWKKYVKHRTAFRGIRDQIIQKNKARAIKNVRAAQNNARHKAANMQTTNGADVSARLNKAAAASSAGHNPHTQSKVANGKKTA